MWFYLIFCDRDIANIDLSTSNLGMFLKSDKDEQMGNIIYKNDDYLSYYEHCIMY